MPHFVHAISFHTHENHSLFFYFYFYEFSSRCSSNYVCSNHLSHAIHSTASATPLFQSCVEKGTAREVGNASWCVIRYPFFLCENTEITNGPCSFMVLVGIKMYICRFECNPNGYSRPCRYGIHHLFFCFLPLACYYDAKKSKPVIIRNRRMDSFACYRMILLEHT